jgi:hypothetical protein
MERKPSSRRLGCRLPACPEFDSRWYLTENQEETMSKQSMFAAILAAAVLAPVAAQADKSWCTDDHMAQMDAKVAEMTDADKKKSAQMHLDQSKAAMKSGDTDGCIAHMKQAHEDMGL